MISKNNLPELKLAKLKSRHDSDSFNFKNINNSNASCNNNITNTSDIQNKKIMILNMSKNHPYSNKNGLIFPKIFNPNKNKFYKQDKNNDSSNSFDNQNSNSNNNRSINQNMRNNGHLILTKMQNKRKKEIIKKNLSEFHRVQKPKNFSFSPGSKKTDKANNNNNDDNNKFRLHFLLQPIQKNFIQIPVLNISSSANNIHSDKNNNNSKNNFNHEINIKLNSSINIKSLYTNKLKQSSSSNTGNIPNDFLELDNITDRNNKNINMLINKLTPISVSPSLINKSQNFSKSIASGNLFNSAKIDYYTKYKLFDISINIVDSKLPKSQKISDKQYAFLYENDFITYCLSGSQFLLKHELKIIEEIIMK